MSIILLMIWLANDTWSDKMVNYIDEMYDTAHDNNILISMMVELLTCCNEDCVIRRGILC